MSKAIYTLLKRIADNEPNTEVVFCEVCSIPFLKHTEDNGRGYIDRRKERVPNRNLCLEHNGYFDEQQAKKDEYKTRNSGLIRETQRRYRERKRAKKKLEQAVA